MIQQEHYYNFGNGLFVPQGSGWNWNEQQIKAQLNAIPLVQQQFLAKHFISIDYLALMIAQYPDEVDGVGQFNFQYCSESNKRSFAESDQFTIRCVQNQQYTTSNIIYNDNRECVIQVDFARHGEALSGHWHQLVPGNLDHDEVHNVWSICPVIFQCIPKRINGNKINPPQTIVGVG